MATMAAPLATRPHRDIAGRVPARLSPRPSTVDDSALDLLRTLARMAGDDPRRGPLRQRVIEVWFPLARHLAQRFRDRGEPMDDLVQIAAVGLIKAIDRFDPEYGNDFAAYAVPTVVGEIRRHFRDRTWDVRVPRRLQELRHQINEATGALSHELGRSPTIADLAAHLERTEDEILEGLDSARAYSAVSLQSLVGDADGGTELGDLFGAEDPEMANAEIRAVIGPALDALGPREQQIIALRFFGNLTQTQIAERVGVSQMHVSRLLARSLAAMRGQLSAGG